MERNCFGIIVKVANIDMCRSFYRDTLQLGEPVVDSNFFVEFKISETSSLMLEKGKIRKASSGNILWSYRPSDIKAAVAHLERNSCPLEETLERYSTVYYYFSDPEHNRFCLIAPASSDQR